MVVTICLTTPSAITVDCSDVPNDRFYETVRGFLAPNGYLHEGSRLTLMPGSHSSADSVMVAPLLMNQRREITLVTNHP